MSELFEVVDWKLYYSLGRRFGRGEGVMNAVTLRNVRSDSDSEENGQKFIDALKKFSIL